MPLPPKAAILRTIEEVAIARGKALATTPASVILSGARNPRFSPLPVLPQQPNQTRVILSEGGASAAEVEGPAVSLPNPPPLTPTRHPDYASAQPTNSTLRPFFNQAIYGTQVLDSATATTPPDPVPPWP